MPIKKGIALNPDEILKCLEAGEEEKDEQEIEEVNTSTTLSSITVPTVSVMMTWGPTAPIPNLVASKVG